MLSEGKIENKLYYLRTSRKWTQKELAEKLSVSRQTIVSLEANRYSPSLMLAFKISELFETGIEDIFSYHKNE
ncbi:helix-turn-helix transcriptional regulator [Planococcus maritimus]|nr:helix-turn-helix transcriptional regulator [Planococcus sp. SK3692]MDE4085192.1 helix-turn-helix transcriptional regulator [Planococcus maritimus]